MRAPWLRIWVRKIQETDDAAEMVNDGSCATNMFRVGMETSVAYVRRVAWSVVHKQTKLINCCRKEFDRLRWYVKHGFDAGRRRVAHPFVTN